MSGLQKLINVANYRVVFNMILLFLYEKKTIQVFFQQYFFNNTGVFIKPRTVTKLRTLGQRQDTTACDTTCFFASHRIKWISSHICSTTKSGCHDKKLLQQKSLWKPFLSCIAATVSIKITIENSFHRNT